MATKKETALVVSQGSEVMNTLLDAMTEGKIDVNSLEKFMDLAERNQKREAERAFHKAFAELKANPPKIIKDMKADYGSGKPKYNYASIGNVVLSIIGGMSKHGLSHRWEMKQNGKDITVRCIISHWQGHSEFSELTAEADTSGSKNPIQGISSTITYLERYTLQAATGIAVFEPDDDGAGADGYKTPASDEEIENAWVDAADREYKKGFKAFSSWLAKNKTRLENVRQKPRIKVEGYINDLLQIVEERTHPETIVCPEGGEIAKDDCVDCQKMGECSIHAGPDLVIEE